MWESYNELYKALIKCPIYDAYITMHRDLDDLFKTGLNNSIDQGSEIY